MFPPSNLARFDVYTVTRIRCLINGESKMLLPAFEKQKTSWNLSLNVIVTGAFDVMYVCISS